VLYRIFVNMVPESATGGLGEAYFSSGLIGLFLLPQNLLDAERSFLCRSCGPSFLSLEVWGRLGR